MNTYKYNHLVYQQYCYKKGGNIISFCYCEPIEIQIDQVQLAFTSAGPPDI